MKEKYGVYINGALVHQVNENLVKSQNVTDKDLEKIIKLHAKRHNIIEGMKLLEPTDESLHILAQEITEIEFKLQDLWHFKRDASMHKFYDLPHCTCPSMDNKERSGTGIVIYSPDCSLHKVK